MGTNDSLAETFALDQIADRNVHDRTVSLYRNIDLAVQPGIGVTHSN